MEQAMIIFSLLNAFFMAGSLGILIANVLLVRVMQKMYTEYFKDRSMEARKK